MKYSDSAITVLIAKETGIIKSSTIFWKNYYSKYTKEEFIYKIKQELNDNYYDILYRIKEDFKLLDDNQSMICPYDETFPSINKEINFSEKPFLLFCKGDVSLLKLTNQSVAVIGVTNPEERIIKREKKIVNSLIKQNQIIISGLAKGCDTIAHEICVKNKGKTIAILPSTIDKIAPSINKNLADKILETKGLLISEYFKEPLSKTESLKRYIERDRLQALFSKAIILIASYRKGEGDSGSRHTMEYAKKYNLYRYVMFDNKIDKDNIQFGLNYDLIKFNKDIKIITPKEIENISNLNENKYPVQGSLF